MGTKVLNLSEVIASPVISGKNEEYVWTGVIKSENITPLLIKDDKIRKDFTRLVKDLEKSTVRYRRNYDIETNMANFLIEEAYLDEAEQLEEHIIEVGGKIKEYLAGAEEYGIDMDLFWVLLCRDYEEIFEKNPNEFKAMTEDARKSLKTFRKNLNENDPCITEVYLPEENKYICYQFLTRGQEKKYKATNSQNQEKLSRVIKNIAGKEELSEDEEYEILKEIVTGVTIIDLSTIFQNSRLAEMQYLTLFKNYLLKKGYTSEKIEEMPLYDIADTALKTYNSDKIEFHAELMSEIIKNNLEYLDIEKLLLVSTIRPLEAFELMLPKIEEKDPSTKVIKELSEKAAEREKNADAYIKQECNLNMAIEKTKRIEHIVRQILDARIISKTTKFNLMYDDKKREVSLKRLEEMMEKFCDGIYLTDVMELNLKYSAYFSEDEMEKWSDDLISRMNFTEDDICILASVNFENFKRLHKAGKVNKDHIKELVKESRIEIESQSNDISEELNLEDINLDTIKRINTRNMFRELYDSQIITESDIVEYFKEGIVTPKMLETIEEGKTTDEIENLHKEFAKFFNEAMILYGCKQYVEEYVKFIKMQLSADGEETEEINKQREIVNCLRAHKYDRIKLFNRYHNMTEEEKHLLGDELLEYYYIEMDVSNEDVIQESVITLYEDGMIDLENIIGLDKKYIIPMLDTLSLEDASKVRASMSFDELKKLLDDIFKDNNITDERKHLIMMNLLIENTKEDADAREYYKKEYLKFEDGSERKADPTGVKRQKTGNGAMPSNKYVYPDFVKWAFYKSLDKNVMIKSYANGFVEFASNKLGVRILEKYYDKKFRPAYGTATYILPEEEYRKNESDLVTITPRGKILESATLREITPRKDRIIHRTKSTDRTWLDEMVRYFDIDYEKSDDSRYTKEELEALKNVVNTYKTCRDEYEI